MKADGHSAYPLGLWDNQVCALPVQAELAVAPVEGEQGPQGTSVFRGHLTESRNQALITRQSVHLFSIKIHTDVLTAFLSLLLSLRK